LDKMLGGPQSQSGRRGEEKIIGSTGTRTPTPWSSKPVASRYTDYAVGNWQKNEFALFPFKSYAYVSDGCYKNDKRGIFTSIFNWKCFVRNILIYL
jgi:hypothetical protein